MTQGLWHRLRTQLRPLQLSCQQQHKINISLPSRSTHLEAQARPCARLPPAGRLMQRDGAVGASILVIDGSADVSHLLRQRRPAGWS